MKTVRTVAKLNEVEVGVHEIESIVNKLASDSSGTEARITRGAKASFMCFILGPSS